MVAVTQWCIDKCDAKTDTRQTRAKISKFVRKIKKNRHREIDEDGVISTTNVEQKRTRRKTIRGRLFHPAPT